MSNNKLIDEEMERDIIYELIKYYTSDININKEEPTITISVAEWERLTNKEEECNSANFLLECIYRYGVSNVEVEQMEKHFFKFDYKFII